jgi:hypothetical protein
MLIKTLHGMHMFLSTWVSCIICFNKTFVCSQQCQRCLRQDMKKQRQVFEMLLKSSLNLKLF